MRTFFLAFFFLFSASLLAQTSKVFDNLSVPGKRFARKSWSRSSRPAVAGSGSQYIERQALK